MTTTELWVKYQDRDAVSIRKEGFSTVRDVLRHFQNDSQSLDQLKLYTSSQADATETCIKADA